MIQSVYLIQYDPSTQKKATLLAVAQVYSKIWGKIISYTQKCCSHDLIPSDFDRVSYCILNKHATALPEITRINRDQNPV